MTYLYSKHKIVVKWVFGNEDIVPYLDADTEPRPTSVSESHQLPPAPRLCSVSAHVTL